MQNNSSSYNNKQNSTSKTTPTTNITNSGDAITRMHPSMKRPRAPIACYRCHHKKVRCDGVHPNCTRCLSTGVLCAYPSSRRSRNTQPTNVDPFIDNLSQLEARIRRIETDLESQRALVRSVCSNDIGAANTSMDGSPTAGNRTSTNNALTSRILKTEKDLQESRSIVAQLRLRGEQRAARGRRAAAAAAASVASSTPGPDKNTSFSGKNSKEAGSTTVNKHQQNQHRNNKLRVNSNIKKEGAMMKSPYGTPMVNDFSNNGAITSPSPPFYFTQSDSTSPVDFINPSSNYYFPYSPNPQYTTSAIKPIGAEDMTPICSDSSNASASFAMMVGDWQLLNDLSHDSSIHNNGFVDPMIIAAAEAHQHSINPPLLSVSSYMAVDEDNSIMAARAKSLSHLPPTSDNMIAIPGLQPSSSSTSTSSNTSTNFGNYNLYNAQYTNFMESSQNDSTLMMIDPQQSAMR